MQMELSIYSVDFDSANVYFESLAKLAVACFNHMWHVEHARFGTFFPICPLTGLGLNML